MTNQNRRFKVLTKLGMALVAVAPLGMMAPGAHAQETLASVGAATAAGAALGAGAGGFRTPSQYVGNAGRSRTGEIEDTDPDFAAAAAAAPSGPAVPSAAPEFSAPEYLPQTGTQLLQELILPQKGYNQMLLSSSASPRRGSLGSKKFLREAGSRTNQRKVANWMAYYLPEDRHNFKSGLWQFVSIEDDYGAYPMVYYFRPWSYTMLNLLKDPQRRGRVIGFRNWQSAMQAGYRPDPVSKPEPGAQIAYVAKLTRTSSGMSPLLGSYIEYLYAGSITERDFNRHYAYALQLRDQLRTRRDTVRYVPDVVSSVFGQVIGISSIPKSVGGKINLQSGEILSNNGSYTERMRREDTSTMYVPTTTTVTPGAEGSGSTPSGLQPGNTDKRGEEYNAFKNRAGGLAAKKR